MPISVIKAQSDPNREDTLLASRAAAGDLSAQRALVERLLKTVRRTASYLARTPDRSDDLAQTALVQILKSSGSFEGRSSLERWADKVTVRTFMTQSRKQTRRSKLDEANPPSSRIVETLDEQVSRQQLREILGHLLHNIRPERRVAVVLHHVQGYSIDEVAEMTGSPAYTVRDRLKNARRQLRKKILADEKLADWVEELG